MAGVNFVLSATTQKYLNDINKAKTEGNKTFESMGKKAQDFSSGVSDAFSSPSGAINGFLTRLGPVGLAIGAVGGASIGLGLKLASMGAEVLEVQKKLESLAKQNNLSTEEMNKYAIAVSTAGMDVEQFGDILKDVADKQGEFLSTGGGSGFIDYLDVINGKIKRTADDFRGLSSLESLKIVQADLDAVGASTAQQTFVMEALASDASKLSGILRMSESEMDNMLKSYAVNRATLTKQVASDISATQANMDMLQNNFNAALANSFRGLIGLANRMSKAASDALYNLSEGAVTQNVIKDYLGGKMEINIGNADEFLKNAQSIQDQMRIDARARAQDELPMYGLGNKKKEDELTAKYIEEGNKRLSDDTIKAADLKNAERINNQGKGTTGNVPDVAVTSYEDANKRLKELATQRTNILVEQGRLETELQNTIGEEGKKALQSRIDSQKSDLEKNAESTKAVNEQIGVYQKEASDKAVAHAKKRLQALGALAKDEEDVAKHAHTMAMDQLKSNLDEGLLTRDEYAQAQINAEQALQDKLLDIQKKKNDAAEKLMKDAYDKQQSIRNLELDFMTHDEDRAKKQVEIEKAKYEELYRLDQSETGNKVISEQEKNNKLAEIDRNAKMEKTERENEHITSEAQRKKEYYETERETILAQYKQGVIDKEERDRLLIKTDENIVAAKRDMTMEQLSLMSELFKGSSQLAAEGSKQQKALFALEKASTLASLGIQMWDKWGKADNWGDKALILGQYGGAIASTAAVTLGQFHDGTDEVSKTGSYILNAGERIIQPEANKDLTKFLKEDGKSGGDIYVEAPLVVQGNVSGDDTQKLQEMLFQQREWILNSINVAKAEKGQA